ncbi:MAG: N-formylglutamate amidohydrolase [Gammaproteobacteria bacterium]|nr:N-formylglutamate amidohydrolase [Gammaproteobacteria bacterium]
MLLLEPEEPPAFEIVNARGGGSAVLVCDHASNRVPRQLGSLGLNPAQLAEHIGWDPGAADVARRLAVHLDAPLVLSGYSRLIIDCNRQLGRADSIPQQSAGVPVPGNCGLASKEKELRRKVLFEPYHRAIGNLLASRANRPTLLLSIHSFTPVLAGIARPWHLGISNGRDRRLAALLLSVLVHDVEIVVGDNQPYPIDASVDYTLPVHAEARGLLNVMIELRQDGIATTAGAAVWAERLARAYRRIETEALNG